MAVAKYFLNTKEYNLETISKKTNAFQIKINNKLINLEIVKFDPKNKILFFKIKNEIYKTHSLNTHFLKIQLPTINKNQTSCFISNFNKTFNLSTKPEKIIPATKINTENQFLETLESPLAGKVIKVYVQKNQMVEKNQPLIVIESMKMENEIRSSQDAFIKTIQISESDLLKQNQTLMTFEKREELDGKSKNANEQT